MCSCTHMNATVVGTVPPSDILAEMHFVVLSIFVVCFI